MSQMPEIRAEELSNAELRQKHVNGKEPTSLRRLGKTETRAVYVEMAVRVRQGRSVLQCPLVPWFAFPQTHDALCCPPSSQSPHNRKASDSSIVCT